MRNIEALRSYFLGKDPQLKETLADNSLRLIGIEGKHFVLRTELIKKLQELKDVLDEEDKRLQDEIDILIREVERLDIELGGYLTVVDFEHAIENYYTKQQVDALLSVIPRFSVEVVQELPNPLEASSTTIYLVPAENIEQSNYYNEYILVNNSWELVGTTSIDMSDYYTKEEVDEKITFTKLTQDLIVTSNSIAVPLSQGWYDTDIYSIYLSDDLINPIVGPHTLFYFGNPPYFDFIVQSLDNGNLLRSAMYFNIGSNEWVFNNIELGEGVKKSPVTQPGEGLRIYNLEDGVYLLKSATQILYDGVSGTKSLYSSTGLLTVYYASNTGYKEWSLLGNITGQVPSLIFGHTDSSGGTITITNANQYSTGETIVGTWTNGKPLYEKIVRIPATADSKTTYGIHTNANFLLIKNAYFELQTGIWTPMPYQDPDTPSYHITIYPDTVNINHVVVDNTYTASFYVDAIVQYTKSTD